MNFLSDFKYLTDENNIYKEISYDEFKELLDGFHSALIIVGGSWSEEFQAVAAEVNKIAKEEKLSEIYVYDPRFINVFKEEEDLRDCLTLENKLKYYYIVEHTGFKAPELVRDTLIAKMEVPTFFAIKNGTCVDYFTSKYIKDPFIREKDNLEDKTLEFITRFKQLISKMNEEKTMFD